MTPDPCGLKHEVYNRASMLFFFFVQRLCINLYLDVFIYGFRVKSVDSFQFFQRNIIYIYIYISNDTTPYFLVFRQLM